MREHPFTEENNNNNEAGNLDGVGMSRYQRITTEGK